MCGVVGFSGEGGGAGARDAFIRLAAEARIRGMHAFGFGYACEEGVVVEKDRDFARLMSRVPSRLPDRIVFHSRYSTSGDYMVANNNQPIERDGSCLVFNGTLDMGTKLEMESRHGVTLVSENDGELALLAALRGELMQFVQQTQGSFAGAVILNGRLHVIRNARRPLWQWRSEAGVFFASTKDIFLRANIGADPEEIQPNVLVEV